LRLERNKERREREQRGGKQEKAAGDDERIISRVLIHVE
jgi:hypothetical protein